MSTPGRRNVMRSDVFSHIVRDHMTVKSLLQQVASIADSAWQKRDDPFHRLRIELLIHLRAEDAVLYPLIEGEEEFRRDMLEALEQRHLLEVLLAELEQLPKNDPRWAIKFALMRELFGRYVDFEEDRVFDDARERLSLQEARDLIVRYTNEKQRIATEIEAAVSVP